MKKPIMFTKEEYPELCALLEGAERESTARMIYDSPIPANGWPGQSPVKPEPIPHVNVLRNDVEMDDTEFWNTLPETQKKEVRDAWKDR